MERPSDEFLADCGRRVLSVTRGFPRQREAFENAAGECAIVIGQLCQTTDEARELTERLVANPLPRWDFAAFRDRATKAAKPAGPSVAEAQAAHEQAWQGAWKAAEAEWQKIPPNRRSAQLEARHAELRRRYEEEPSGWTAGRYGAAISLRTLFVRIAAADRAMIVRAWCIQELIPADYERPRTAGPIACHVCGARPDLQPRVALKRINEKGVPGVFVCRGKHHGPPKPKLKRL